MPTRLDDRRHGVVSVGSSSAQGADSPPTRRIVATGSWCPAPPRLGVPTRSSPPPLAASSPRVVVPPLLLGSGCRLVPRRPARRIVATGLGAAAPPLRVPTRSSPPPLAASSPRGRECRGRWRWGGGRDIDPRRAAGRDGQCQRVRAAHRRGFRNLARPTDPTSSRSRVRCPGALPEGVGGYRAASTGNRAGRNGVAILTRTPPAAVPRGPRPRSSTT